MGRDQCASTQTHSRDGPDEAWADEFGLTHAQMRSVQDAVPGNEDHGYAQALIGVDGAWRGIRVQATDREKAVIDYSPETSEVPDVAEAAPNNSPPDASADDD